MRKSFYINNDIEITQREIIVSVSIISILLMIGIFISNIINESILDKNEIYNKAVKIDSQELFEYGMETNVGNAFVYGELRAVDPVSFPELNSTYMEVKKEKERYTRHEREVTVTDSEGNSHTETEVYYSWDYVESEEKSCTKITFNNVVFDSNMIQLPYKSYIETQNESSTVRYKYYGSSISHIGTIFTDLRNNTISYNTPFYGYSLEETVDYLIISSTYVIISFWIIWIAIIVLLVWLFYTYENKWLN